MKTVKKIKLKINKECQSYLSEASERCRLLYNFSLTDRKEAKPKKMCSRCGQLHDMPLAKRTMVCDCGLTLDRDTNSAVNILTKYCGRKAVPFLKNGFSGNVHKY
jgi:hypothetical protein